MAVLDSVDWDFDQRHPRLTRDSPLASEPLTDSLFA